MVYEYLIIELALVLLSIFYLHYTHKVNLGQFKKIALLSIIGFALFLIEIPFHSTGTWRFSTEFVSNITILTMPVEELLFYTAVFPLVAAAVWIFSGKVEERFA